MWSARMVDHRLCWCAKAAPAGKYWVKKYLGYEKNNNCFCDDDLRRLHGERGQLPHLYG